MSDQPSSPDDLSADATDASEAADSRRRFLKKAAVTGAFVVPVVMSVSLDGAVIKQATAMAAGSDGTNLPPPRSTFGPNVIGDPTFDVP